MSPLGVERHDGTGWGAARRDLGLGEDSGDCMPNERPQGPCAGGGHP